MGTHVLVPVDGSEHSEKAFEHALELPDVEITLLHVIAPVSAYGYADEEYFDYEGFQAQTERMYDRGEEILAEFRDTAESRGVDVETVLSTGKPAREILDTAETTDVDHIVMGSRGRSGVGRVLFGSVAETVTRRASVPVTIVR